MTPTTTTTTATRKAVGARRRRRPGGAVVVAGVVGVGVVADRSAVVGVVGVDADPGHRPTTTDREGAPTSERASARQRALPDRDHATDSALPVQVSSHPAIMTGQAKRKAKTMQITMTNEDTGQVCKVDTNPDSPIVGATTIEIFNVDEDGNDVSVGWRSFGHQPASMSDLDLMCQEVPGYDHR